MKRHFVILAAALLCACATPPAGTTLAPAQQAINAATVSYTSIDTAIVQADAAVKAGVLKGQDARNAVKAFTDAKASLDVGLVALRAANAAASAAAAASGVSK